VLVYTAEATAAAEVARLITAAGFDPVTDRLVKAHAASLPEPVVTSKTYSAILDQLDEDNASLAKQDYNQAEGRYEFSLQDVWTLHPDLPLIVGDVLHNARSALDHLAWARAREPGTHTGFPILDPARPIPTQRRHSSLGMLSPANFERRWRASSRLEEVKS
jgi:hypothetical protein